MSSRQRHRGQHSNDPRLFSEKWIPVLNEAVEDYSWLISRGYSDDASLKLVGDRYRLDERQRRALARAGCTDEARQTRRIRRMEAEGLRGRRLVIDGYNLLITVESALAGGIVLDCRDDCYRDIASVHGTYRDVEETQPALTMIGISLQKLEVEHVFWLLDSPVSNSGRLKLLMLDISRQYNFDWKIELSANPDRKIAGMEDVVAITSDSWVLDHSKTWFNMHRHVVSHVPDACIIPLKGRSFTSDPHFIHD
jgi:hypothetical protein